MNTVTSILLILSVCLGLAFIAVVNIAIAFVLSSLRETIDDKFKRYYSVERFIEETEMDKIYREIAK